MDRLKHLVFSFYREEARVKELLKPLHSCRFSRQGDSIHVECNNVEHLEEVEGLLMYLKEPFCFLALGRRIIFQVPGLIQHSHPLKNTSCKDLFTDNAHH